MALTVIDGYYKNNNDASDGDDSNSDDNDGIADKVVIAMVMMFCVSFSPPVDGRWRCLAEEIKMEPIKIQYLEQIRGNPAEEVLKFWEVKAQSTVKHMYDTLVKLGFPLIADTL